MMDINNYYEYLVTEELYKMAKEVEELANKDFMEDVACIALNDLPSRYVRSLVDLHSHFSYSDRDEMEKTVTEAVTKAIQKAKRRADQIRE